MQIYLLRHPETDWNRQGRFQGQTDIPINKTGMEQLEQTLPFLITLPVQIVYTSPLKRARVVAQSVSQTTGLPMLKDQRIMEVNCGRWEGKVAQTLAIEEPELFELWKSNPYDFRLPGGESYQDVENRTTAFLKDIASYGKNALVVSHGIAITTMLRFILQIPKNHVRALHIENLGLVKLEVDANGIAYSIVNPAHELQVALSLH
ncbi:MAG TPA: histidine phosphatase family protein [Coprothermobacter sp.]|nr:histidine phosphatase family protein [Coprothermobacter sp.]